MHAMRTSIHSATWVRVKEPFANVLWKITLGTKNSMLAFGIDVTVGP
jgi:hypothetical protein